MVLVTTDASNYSAVFVLCEYSAIPYDQLTSEAQYYSNARIVSIHRTLQSACKKLQALVSAYSGFEYAISAAVLDTAAVRDYAYALVRYIDTPDERRVVLGIYADAQTVAREIQAARQRAGVNAAPSLSLIFKFGIEP